MATSSDAPQPVTTGPTQDPTALTTQLVDRALAAYREVVEARLDGIDRATLLVAADLVKISQTAAQHVEHLRDDIDRQVLSLREYLLGQIRNVESVGIERFAAIDTRFLERDTRTAQAADESRISLDAALAAAKEAVSEQNKANAQAIAKSEVATQKQIDSMVALMTTSNKSLEDKISDLKARLDRGEGRDTGSADTRTEKRLDSGQILLAISVIIAAVGVVIAFVATRH